MMNKKCTKCKKDLPATTEYFNKDKHTKCGLSSWCRECKKQYKLDNKEKIKISKKKYREFNKEKIKEKDKKYYSDNIEKIKSRQKQYRYKNKERISKQYKVYYQTNKQHKKEYLKQYVLKNKEKFRIKNLKRYSLKKSLPSTLTIEQWKEIKSKFNNKCAYCGRELPLAQEHFIPLSKGGEYTVNNIIPACKSCNSSKNDSDFFNWYPTYRYYSEKRERNILNYLGYENNMQQLSII